MLGKRRIYLDFAAATPMDRQVRRAVTKSLKEDFGNPSAPHGEGRRARASVEKARIAVARSLSVKPEEIVFTSGGTEANNLAIRGLAEGLRARGAKFSDLHFVTSTIEHSSLIETFRMLEKEGASVSWVSPGSDGVITPESVLKALKKKTALISLAHVNSEIGTIQPIAAIGAALIIYDKDNISTLKKFAPEAHFPLLHADAAQSPLYLDAGPHVLKADLVSYDAQKIMGPKGVGILFRNFSIPLAPIMGGGTQERGLRPGTENVSAIVGAGVAFQLAKEGRGKREEYVRKLRDYLIALVRKKIPEAELIGSEKKRIANNACFSVSGADGDYLSVLMDKEGVAVTPRSACMGSGGEVSHVVLALTGDQKKARGTIRFSLWPRTREKDIEKAVSILARVIKIAR